jgi:hypothetical protein
MSGPGFGYVWTDHVGYTDATGLQGMHSYTVSQLSSNNGSQLWRLMIEQLPWSEGTADMLGQAIKCGRKSGREPWV